MLHKPSYVNRVFSHTGSQSHPVKIENQIPLNSRPSIFSKFHMFLTE